MTNCNNIQDNYKKEEKDLSQLLIINKDLNGSSLGEGCMDGLFIIQQVTNKRIARKDAYDLY